MVLRDELKELIVNRVREAVPAEAIYLYGPGVEGPEAEDRHLELLVVVPEAYDPPSRRGIHLKRSLSRINRPIEARVVTHDELERERHHLHSLEHRVLLKGERIFG